MMSNQMWGIASTSYVLTAAEPTMLQMNGIISASTETTMIPGGVLETSISESQSWKPSGAISSTTTSTSYRNLLSFFQGQQNQNVLQQLLGSKPIDLGDIDSDSELLEKVLHRFDEILGPYFLTSFDFWLHQTEFPWACDNCELRFRQKRELQVHGEVLHSGHPCNICGEVLTNECLINHTVQVQQTSTPHACESCGAAYHFKRDLIDHLMNVHGKRLFPCTDCDRSYAQKNRLKTHMLKSHNKEMTQQA